MPLNDQMRLLQTSWPEVLSLSLAFRSIPLNTTNPKLQWSADFCMNEKEARECGMEELFFQVSRAIRIAFFFYILFTLTLLLFLFSNTITFCQFYFVS